LRFRTVEKQRLSSAILNLVRATHSPERGCGELDARDLTSASQPRLKGITAHLRRKAGRRYWLMPLARQLLDTSA
jgi:hypothetical protein